MRVGMYVCVWKKDREREREREREYLLMLSRVPVVLDQ